MTIEVLEFRALNDLSRRTQKLGKSPSRCGPKSEGKESLYISSPYSGAVFFGTWNICRILPEIVKVVYKGPFSQGWESDLLIFELSIFLIFKKDPLWSNRSRQSFSRLYRSFEHKKTINSKKRYFSYVFVSFSLFLAKRLNRSSRSSIFFKCSDR